ncbi:hypothetical protein SMKC049_13830 [Serratia marcescens]|nr:hypothetical protein SMKC049_13830 [Serratia marcescens]
MAYRRHGIWIRMAFLLPLSFSVIASTVNDTFLVSAVIAGGCAFGSGSGGGNTNFGTINFGERADVSTNVDVTSTSGAGSLIVTCTPGTAITIALDYGLNGGSSSNRYLINSQGTRTLAYQLYKDSGYSQVWGTGSLANAIATFPATTQTYTIYARLFATSNLPPAGTYTDTVTVTLTY